VSLNFERGVYGLLGPNGAGKTTLMRMMVGVLPPSSGKVTLDGVTIGELGAKYRIIPEQPKVSATLDGTSVEGYVEDVYSQYASSTAEEPGAEQHVSGKVVFGAILLVVGAVILFKNLSSYAIITIPRWMMPYFELARALALPVLLIVIGLSS